MHPVIFTFSIICCFSAFGQTGYIKNYDLDRPATIFTNILLKGDTLVLCGLARSLESPYKQDLFLAKVDTSGNLLEQHFVSDTSANNYGYTAGNVPNGFIKLEDGSGYIMTGGLSGVGGMVFNLDNNGQLVWKKLYEDSQSLVDFYADIIEVENGFLVVGRKQSLDFSSNLFVMKINQNGHRLWEKAYGTENHRRDYFGSIFKINNNEYAIGCSTGPNQGIPWQQHNNTIKFFAIDSLGNELWKWESEPTLEETWVKGLYTINSSWVYTTVLTDFEPDGSFNRQPKFIIRDNSFSKVADFPLDDIDLGIDNYLLDLVPLSNGGWIGIGVNTEEVPEPNIATSHAYAWLVRLNENGDSLWTRNDLTFPDNLPHSTGQALHSAIELPSGSIIAAGYFDPIASSSDLGILLKVDANGCMKVLDCRPVVNTKEETMLEKPKIEVYPNPSKGEFNFKFDPTSTITGGLLEIINGYGQKMASFQLPEKQLSVIWNASDQPNGLYFFNLFSSGKTVSSGTLVLKR